MEASKILAALKAAVLEKQTAVQFAYKGPNQRSYGCVAPGCPRRAYAKGLCNAHYIRAKKGISLTTPLRARKRDDVCTDCGVETGGKGGWGLCPKHYKRVRAALLKGAVVRALGGACRDCGGVYPLRVFDFHHVDVKSGDPSAALNSKSLSCIADELAKCVLLCANCHRLRHHDPI